MKANKRAVAIAKDVIENLDALNVQRGAFLKPADLEYDKRAEKVSKFGRMKNYLRKLKFAKKECRVCALGATYLSSFNLPEFAGQAPSAIGMYAEDLVIECAKNIFGSDALEIESAFELGQGWSQYEGDLSAERARDARKFGRSFTDAKDRLRAIMQNVIDHDGYFVPGENGENANKYLGGTEAIS